MTRFVQQEAPTAAAGRLGRRWQRCQDGHRQVNFGRRTGREGIGLQVGLVAVLAGRARAEIQPAVGRGGRAAAAQIVARIGQANGRAGAGAGPCAQTFPAGQQRGAIEKTRAAGRASTASSSTSAGHAAHADVAGRHAIDRRLTFKGGDALSGRFRQMDVQAELERVLALQRRLLDDADTSAGIDFQRNRSVRLHGGVSPRAGRDLSAVVVVVVLRVGAERVVTGRKELQTRLRSQPAGAQGFLALQSGRSGSAGTPSAAHRRARSGVRHLVMGGRLAGREREIEGNLATGIVVVAPGVSVLLLFLLQVAGIRLALGSASAQVRSRPQENGGRRVGGQAERSTAADEGPGRRDRSQLVFVFADPRLDLLAALERLAQKGQPTGPAVQLLILLRIVGGALAAAAGSIRVVLALRQEVVDGRRSDGLQRRDDARRAGHRRTLGKESLIFFHAETMDANGAAHSYAASGSSSGSAQTSAEGPAGRHTAGGAPWAVGSGRMTRKGATQHSQERAGPAGSGGYGGRLGVRPQVDGQRLGRFLLVVRIVETARSSAVVDVARTGQGRRRLIDGQTEENLALLGGRRFGVACGRQELRIGDWAGRAAAGLTRNHIQAGGAGDGRATGGWTAAAHLDWRRGPRPAPCWRT